ncbi:hypothetical protein AF74_01995 [Aliarcobacter butzleri L349]|nr:hypothetical protein AF74_01995 [Aliarcobacter butzleri L349]
MPKLTSFVKFKIIVFAAVVFDFLLLIYIK